MFDLAAAEIAGLLIGGATTPTSAEVAARFAERQRWCTLEPPLFLGAPPAEPPIDVLPGAMAHDDARHARGDGAARGGRAR